MARVKPEPAREGGNAARPGRRPLRRALPWLVLTLALLLMAGLAAALAWEARHAKQQSRWFHDYARELTWSLEPGESPGVRFPVHGPFDQRMGYTELPLFLQRLQQRDYVIEAQTRFSPALAEYTGRGLYPPYREKSHAGLRIEDCRGEALFEFSYPAAGYADFGRIPAVVVQTLLYIENRKLLDTSRPLANPAIDWGRLAAAAGSQLRKLLQLQRQAVGGSTLATQIEKFRHSPHGMTDSAAEKLRQVVSASVRAYQPDPQTLAVRREIVRDYLNTVPMSAIPGHGEVHGLDDSLRVWFGADFTEVNRLLDPMRGAGASDAERGLALRQVLSLMIAQRRPSHYLGPGRSELPALTDSHLRLLVRDGVVDEALGRAALAQQVKFREGPVDPAGQAMASSKGIALTRRHLSALLNAPLYKLDRLDMEAASTLHGGLQAAASNYLARLAEPEFARSVGLLGGRQLRAQDTAHLRYSFTLFELDGERFAVRAQTDNTDQPFDINEHSKLELGSTAKLRVLATYLEIVAELHARLAGLAPQQLRTTEAASGDPITRWAIRYLLAHPQAELQAMTTAALERRYSADPGERFFTGGGMHTFSNFSRSDNGRFPTVRDALRESINLPFVRLMRDLVRYTTYQMPGNSAELLRDDSHPRRQEYLTRFADREGTTYLLRFWRKYRELPTAQRLERFLEGVRKVPSRVAAVHRFLYPLADEAAFRAFIEQQLAGQRLSDKQLAALYRDHAPGRWSLADQAYIARAHPLDLWLVRYLLAHPEASFEEILADSATQRQEAYAWLFRSRHKSARDSRIRTMLEAEAFGDISARWRRLGFPFGQLVPSLATALGSSGDRPAALAELIGIILNDGIRLPTVRIDQLHFAAGTPYETQLSRVDAGERVMLPEVAAALREALSQVVEGGTARRLQGSITLADGSAVQMGGKTGTGDNRIETVGPGGRVTSSRAVSRTATFVFFLGPRHFGTLTAYVTGEQAGRLRFTSTLPLQALIGMGPLLEPYLGHGQRMCRPQ